MELDGKGVGEEMRVEGGETVFRLCCMRKKSMFNNRGESSVHVFRDGLMGMSTCCLRIHLRIVCP